MILILTLWITTLLLLRHAIRLTRAINRRDLLTDDIVGCCESLGFVGISVLCSRVTTLEQIEELLAESYDRYEVVAVLDSEIDDDAFHRIVEHYRMIRVNSTSTHELPTATVRALYRSRQRSFRRLILADRPQASVYDDLDTALGVASYAYVIPIGEGERLCPRAIESLAITLSQSPSSCEVLYSSSSDRHLFHREYVIRNGGFSPHILRYASTSECIRTAIPIVHTREIDRRRKFLLTGTILLLVTTLLIVEWRRLGIPATIASASALWMAWMTIRYESRIVGGAKCPIKVLMCYFRNVTEIFSTRKFII